MDQTMQAPQAAAVSGGGATGNPLFDEFRPLVAAACGLGAERDDLLDEALQADEARQGKPGAGAPPGLAAALIGLAAAKLRPERVRAKQAANILRDIGLLDSAVTALGSQVAAYNQIVSRLDPGLAAEISSASASAKVDQKDFLGRVLDTRVKDPALDGFRTRMGNLLQRPELAAARQEIAQTVSLIEKKASYIGNTVANHKGGSSPEAAQKLSETLSARFGERLGAVPTLAADLPSDKPEGLVERAQKAAEEMAKQIAEMVNALAASIKSALGGGPKPK